MNPEITTSTERAATVEAEPRLSLSELQSLLRDAAALERASRPIHIHQDSSAVTVLPTDPAHMPPRHPGIDVRYPAQAEAEYVVPWAPLRHPVSVRTWGATLAYGGVGVLLTGAADGVATGDGTLSVGACIAGLVAIVAGIARAQFEDGAR